MIFSFDYTAAALIMQLLILVLYLSRRRVPTRINRVFLGLIVVDLITISADFLTRRLNVYWWNCAVWKLILCNTLFYVFYILRNFLFLDFTAELCEEWEENTVLRWLAVIVPMTGMELLVLLSPFTGWIFSITEQGVAEGPLHVLIDVQFMYCVVMMLVMLERGAGRNDLELDRTMGFVFTGSLALGGLTRIAFPTVSAVNLFSVFSMALMFFGYMNPELYTDIRTRVFNYKGWKLVLRERFHGRRTRDRGSLAGFMIRNYSEVRDIYGEKQFEAGMRLIGQYLNQQFRGMNVFYLGTGHFVIQSFRRFDEEAVLGEITSQFTRHWKDEHTDIILSAGMIRLDRNCILPDEETAIGCVRYAFEQVSRQVFFGTAVIDRQTLKEYRRKTAVRQVLNNALDENRLQMYLQPIVRAGDEKVVGCEALARLDDRNGEVIYPDEFIPAAEQNGIIIPLGEQMFRKACSFIASERVNLGDIEWINVNLSPIQCMDDSLADHFLEIIQELSVDARTVFLEVTEKALNDASVLHKHMARLREEGVSFVLDDFGSFSSNLDRLKENPFMSIKLDRKMVWNYFKSPDSILPHIIAACHEMNLTVVAEGIENSYMAETLRMLGCDYFQGYYYSRPIPAADFLENYC